MRGWKCVVSGSALLFRPQRCQELGGGILGVRCGIAVAHVCKLAWICCSVKGAQVRCAVMLAIWAALQGELAAEGDELFYVLL